MTAAADDQIRAYLVDQPNHDAAMTDEQRAIRDTRRQILGSSDDTYALNRAEADR